jgi:hypothetical protein
MLAAKLPGSAVRATATATASDSDSASDSASASDPVSASASASPSLPACGVSSGFAHSRSWHAFPKPR